MSRRDAEDAEISRRRGEPADVVSNYQIPCYRTCAVLVKINY